MNNLTTMAIIWMALGGLVMGGAFVTWIIALKNDPEKAKPLVAIMVIGMIGFAIGAYYWNKDKDSEENVIQVESTEQSVVSDNI